MLISAFTINLPYFASPYLISPENSDGQFPINLSFFDSLTPVHFFPYGDRTLVNNPVRAAGMPADYVLGWEIVRKMNI